MTNHHAGPITDPAISIAVEKLLERAGALLTGHFHLSSGLHSDRYCQCARLFEDPAAAAMVAKLMRESLPRAIRAQTVLAPALGGVLWGYELARAAGTRALFAERDRDGAFALRRGFALNEGDRVILAEDVVTTGKSVLELAPIVEAAGAEIVAFAAIVDRSKGTFSPRASGIDAPAYALCDLQFNTWEPDGCPMCDAGIPIDKPGSRPPDQHGDADAER
jgi:orotate phosphoribosyltransferase